MHEKLGLTKEDDELIFENLMKAFDAPDGYSKKNYYGVASMRYKKNGYWGIRLQLEYSSNNPVNTKPIEIDNLDDYITALVVLESRAKTSAPKRINLRSKQAKQVSIGEPKDDF